MPLRLPHDLLERSAQESSRLLALAYIEQIDQARNRLGDNLDREALHDFRVGLRRLRSAMRAYRVQLEGSIDGKLRRRIRNLARATNDGRDVEVQLGWLESQAAQLGPEEIRGFYWLVGRLEDRKHRTHGRAIADVARRYDKAATRLRRSLGILRIELASGQDRRPANFREVTGALAQQQLSQLRDDLSRIGDGSDAEQVHRTRISLKRLRYLLEPLARRNRRAGALVRRFKEAQDFLGEHHDMHILSAAVGSLGAGATASSFPGLDPGMVAVRRFADQAAATAFERFQSTWGGEQRERILSRADELGRALQQPALPAQAQPAGPTPSPSGDLLTRETAAPPSADVDGPTAQGPDPIGEPGTANTTQQLSASTNSGG